MNDSHIAIRYARAFFELAREKDKLDSFHTDLVLVQQTISENELLKKALLSPVVSISQKVKSLHEIFSGAINPESLSFISLVVKNKRESYLESIIRDFSEIYKKHMNIKTIRLTTAVQPPESFIKNLSDRVSKAFDCKTQVKTLTNPEIIGGFILRVDDLQFNGSVSGQLRRIKQTLTKA